MSAQTGSVQPEPPCSNQISHTPPLGEPGFNKARSFGKTRCRCSCGCARFCRYEGKEDRSANETASPARGRSPTPKLDRTNGNARPGEAHQAPPPAPISWPTSVSSVDGQEGLARHQIARQEPVEVGDLGTHAHDSIQRWLAQHHILTHSYGIPNSPEASMLVESSTIAPSLASSGFLPPRATSSLDLLSFVGGFDESNAPKVQQCAFTPLWLTHERRYCRNMHFEGGEATATYHVTLGMFDIE